jgi:hypothetical protein
MAPTELQRKTLKHILWVVMFAWALVAVAFIFGDFRARVVPTAGAFVMTMAYLGARSPFNMKERR